MFLLLLTKGPVERREHLPSAIMARFLRFPCVEIEPIAGRENPHLQTRSNGEMFFRAIEMILRFSYPLRREHFLFTCSLPERYDSTRTNCHSEDGGTWPGVTLPTRRSLHSSASGACLVGTSLVGWPILLPRSVQAISVVADGLHGQR